MSQDAGFHQRFVAEAREHLASMTAAMIALERNDGDPDPLIEQLLRAAHSIKGGAGLVGLRNLMRLSHGFEEVVENIRDGRIPRRPEVIDALLAVMDRMAALVDDVEHSDAADIAQPLEQLHRLNTGPAATALAARILPGEFEITDQLRKAWPSQNAFLYGVKLDWWQCEQQYGISPAGVAERIERAGALLDSRTPPVTPKFDEGVPSPPCWLLAVLSSVHPLEQFTQQLDIPCAMVLLLEQSAGAGKTGFPPEPSAARPAPPTSLRVSVPLVDRMMALTGELVLTRNEAARVVERSDAPLRRLMRRLDAVTNELQDAALQMRAQPVGTLFDRFPRVVRDLARQLGKQIDVRITGAEVELDKTILELLVDPLTHLVRNCCDHGIEPPETRTLTGKPAAGRIDLSARQERGQIVIEIRDDGRGIDAEAVKRKAIEHGVKTAAELERMADQQVFSLILLSGYSTAKQVTDLSGRGMGMDVVRTNLEQVGGVIEIDSSPGRGSVFSLRLPLTLAIMPCLLLGSDGDCFGMPQRDVEALLLLGDRQSRHRIEHGHRGEVLRWRGRTVPVIRLREVLRRREPLDAAALAEIAERYQARAAVVSEYVAIIRLGSRRFGMVFDAVMGSENIVVKPLHPLLRPLGIYAATTILGDGQVSLIFSAEGLARHSGILEQMTSEAAAALEGPDPGVAPEPLLLFRSGPQELLAVRMNAVRRVVPVRAERIERVGDREIYSIDGIATNILRLDQFLSISPCPQQAQLSLLLPRDTAAPVGIVASQIVDTVNASGQLDTRAYQADGVLGSILVDDNLALVIDPARIIDRWADRTKSDRLALPGAGERVLVVDDAKFFQRLVSDHLQGAGFQVQVAENGQEALAALERDAFDLVVSDIEMPVMDGHGLARAIRAQERLKHLPLIALTTLNTAESRAAASASGFDAYQVKLDRHTLLQAVAGLLNSAGRQIQLKGGPGHG